MPIPKRAAKRDANEDEIVITLEAAGCTVVRISMPDVPDLLVGYADIWTGEPRNVLMEVKSEGGKLRPGQAEFIENWRGDVVTVWSVEDALKAIGRM